MSEFVYGLVLQLKSIKNLKYYELIDMAFAYEFINTHDDTMYLIVSGKKEGTYIKKDKNQPFSFLSLNNDRILFNNGRIEYKEFAKHKIDNFHNVFFNEDLSGEITDARLKKLIMKEKANDSNKKDKGKEENSEISSIFSEIKKTIISQDEQIRSILTSLFKNQIINNMKNIDNETICKLKENILICGPTGTGKTEILKRISKYYRLPLVIEDATTFSETGYVGRKVSDMIEDLIAAADGDAEKAEEGILIIDEFDKLAEKYSDKENHVSKEGVQRSLLKLLDGTEFNINNRLFDTSKLTIVCAGAFSNISKTKDYVNLDTEDFVNYGIMRELMGRFSKIIYMNNLSKDDIKVILEKSDYSPLNTYKLLFKELKVKLSYNDEFLDYISELAYSKQTGARSLKTIFDSCISEALYDIFSGDKKEISLVKPSLKTNSKAYILK